MEIGNDGDEKKSLQMCTHFSWLSQRLEKHLSERNSNGQIGNTKEWEFQLLSGKG